MVSHLFFSQLALFVLVWLFVMLHLTGSKPGVTIPPVPAKPKRKRSTEPKPFAGLTQTPYCVWCEQETGETVPAPPPRPVPMPSTNRRPRTVDTSMHFCPHLNCGECTPCHVFSQKPHTSVVDFQWVAEPPLPASITCISLSSEKWSALDLATSLWLSRSFRATWLDDCPPSIFEGYTELIFRATWLDDCPPSIFEGYTELIFSV